MKPERSQFTRTELKIIDQYRTPYQVQRYLKTLSYNHDHTIWSFREVVKRKTAHCLEGALTAAAILEQHGYPPLLMSLESVDNLDHVLFVFRASTGWGAVGRSRDTGLHGRRPVFRSARDLALSYFDPYVDNSGRITAYGIVNLNDLSRCNWRFSESKLTRVENYLIECDHTDIVSSERRYQRLLKRFKEFKAKYPNRQVTYFDNKDTWM